MNRLIVKTTKNQTGAASQLMVVAVVAVLGVLAFLFISSTGPFNKGQFSSLYPTQVTEAKNNPRQTPVPTAAPGVTLSMSPATNKITCRSLPCGTNVGEALNLNTGNQQVSAVELHITFDPAIVHITKITPGTLLTVILTAASFDNVAGTASITLGAQPTAPANGTGTLATITFSGIKYGTSPVTYALSTQTASIGMTTNSLVSSKGASIQVSK